ncbi:hypothetical protein LOK74_07985 [Brevibacillus humidisoli]|uniref:hypothetical protein n=1 Tax=Brevibacillus humidisoli TaxID=2895522 RepID=UPI001E2F1FE4|nr:hypothetical protein [Brevibacillus humidisoli]UFJ42414.1 hypothetical protein LOK74_07985 [Brevibacillus humidisoli]
MDRQTLADRLLAEGVDWRYPDQEGLSERVLDCRQSSIKEVLRWKGYDKLIRVFLNRFDCFYSGLLLRRSEPKLMLGWGLTTHSSLSPEGVRSMIRSVFSRIGYCLLYTQAYHMPFSAYYGRYEVLHWSLVIDCDDEQVTLVDDSGSPVYFQGYVGKVPWEVLADGWRQNAEGGVAYLVRETVPMESTWPGHCRQLLVDTVSEMVDRGGLNNLAGFIQAVEAAPLTELIEDLERLEFDLNYYRKARELWKLAVASGHFPAELTQGTWVEHLSDACQNWSLVMGVAMKWRRQPSRDYRAKLTDYLWQAYEAERACFLAMAELLQKEGSR